MKISLAIITGNAERYIERFLRCFAPLADEIVIVRAIGDQVPDATFELAKKTINFLNCTNSVYGADKALVTAECFNLPGDHASWPHIDDYAAARNLAFSLCTNEWIFWADTDDTIDPHSVALILDALQRHHQDFDGFALDYDIAEDGVRVRKDRLIRKGAASWRYPIHEELKFQEEKARIIFVRDALITHAPIGSRKTNDERNLRILRSMEADGSITLGHRFHLVQTLRALGMLDASAALAMSLLQEKDLADDERYEILMNLAERSGNLTLQGNLYLQALGVNPRRREAYGELAIWCIITGRFTDALGYATAMMGIPRPRDYIWNARSMYYGWFGIKILAMALRVNGHQFRADVLQFNHFKRHGAKISLLHATRGRGRQAFKAQHHWLTRAADPDAIEHIYAIDDDDRDSIALAFQRSIVVPAGGGCVAAWNAAAAICRGQVFVQMSDDWDPPIHWDRLILDALGDLEKPAVLAVSDGTRTDDLLCIAICTRARYLQQGFLFHPDFEPAAMYSDNYFTRQAYADGVVIEARDIVFEHQHPAFGKAPMDATYAAQNAPEKYAAGKAIYDRLIGPSPEGVYPTGYFQRDLHAGQFDSPDLLAWIKSTIPLDHPIHDLGCGNGYLVRELTAAGYTATGYEGDPIDEDHVRCDLSRPLPLRGAPGHVICVEVGEHIPAVHAPMLFQNIAAATAPGAWCIMSWAVPDQEGRGHVNCAESKKVISAMEFAGFTYKPELMRSARAAVNDVKWLKTTLLVFLKN